MIKCPNCNATDHEPTAKFCHVCGIELQLNTKRKTYELATANKLPTRRTFTANGVSFNMILVEGGMFMMGAHGIIDDVYDRESQGHPVSLETFWIGETQVTQELWKAVMGDNPSAFKEKNTWSLNNLLSSSYKTRPVECVSWEDCQDFIKELNRLTNEKFRLPTEAEWEYAARGGQLSKGYIYAGSNNPDEVAWYQDNSGKTGGIYNDRELEKLTKNHRQTHLVMQKVPNELGIYDMSGNVQEWCQDESSPIRAYYPDGPIIGFRHTVRGGSWEWPSWQCIISHSHEESSRNDITGLRLALFLRGK